MIQPDTNDRNHTSFGKDQEHDRLYDEHFFTGPWDLRLRKGSQRAYKGQNRNSILVFWCNRQYGCACMNVWSATCIPTTSQVLQCLVITPAVAMLFQLTNSKIVSLLSQSAAKLTRLCDHASCLPIMMMNGDYKPLALDTSKPGGRFEGRLEEVSSIISTVCTSDTSQLVHLVRNRDSREQHGYSTTTTSDRLKVQGEKGRQQEQSNTIYYIEEKKGQQPPQAIRSSG